MNMSDTPRTDRLIKNCNGWHHVPAEFARELERELAAAKERIRRMEEAGDEMAWCLGDQNHFASAWRQAKEAKP